MKKEIDSKVNELMRVELISSDCNCHIHIAIGELLLERVRIFLGRVVERGVVIKSCTNGAYG